MTIAIIILIFILLFVLFNYIIHKLIFKLISKAANKYLDNQQFLKDIELSIFDICTNKLAAEKINKKRLARIYMIITAYKLYSRALQTDPQKNELTYNIRLIYIMI